MQTPLQIIFRDIPRSEAMEQQIRQRAQELERHHHRITACHVTVSVQHRHQRKGQLYHLSIHLVLPDGEVTVNRRPDEHHAHEESHVAIRDAFDAVRRQLQDGVRRRRDQVKHHELPLHGMIARLFRDDGHGVIAAPDGQEVHFRQDCVADGSFYRLHAGAEVLYVLSQAEVDGRREASSVVPIAANREPAD